MRTFILSSFLFFSLGSLGQEVVTLPFEAYLFQVATRHPQVRSLELVPAMARKQEQVAKGGFDPVLSGSVAQKVTAGTPSYTLIEPSLKVPTPIGVDVKAGLDQSSGIAVNPEHAKVDPLTRQTKDVQYQLWYAGVSVPLLRGLMTDERRNQLRLAKVGLSLSEAEKIAGVNKVMLSAAKAYWDWQMQTVRADLLKENLRLATLRLDFTKKRIAAGEEKPIDSVEASLEVLRRQTMLTEAELELANSRVEVSAFLWDDQQQPALLPENTLPSKPNQQPSSVNDLQLGEMIHEALKQHPEIVKQEMKVQQSALDRKLAAEYVKPVLSLDYFPFQTYTAGTRDEVSGLFMRNYKFGATFYSSLYLRKERGKLSMADFKIRQNELQLKSVSREVTNQITTAWNEVNAIVQLIQQQQQLVTNASLLRDAEETRFQAGESSLFLVNQRERALIEARVKLAELHAKSEKARYQLRFAAGNPL